MVAIAGARFSVLHNSNLVWTYLWQYIKARVACIMVPLQTFRTLFISGGSRVFRQQDLQEQLPSIKRRVSSNMKLLNMASWERGKMKRMNCLRFRPQHFPESETSSVDIIVR